MKRKETMSQNVAHDFRTKTRTGDVLISENVDFAGLLLSDTVLAGLSRSGFKKPSPIQLKAIPIGRCGLDLIVQAKSGTGKTVVFTTIALESLQLESNSTQVLVMAPTREIAVQIWEVMKAISSEMVGIQCRMFIGGLPVNQDKQKLKHCHVAIGTPGRIKQLIENDMLKTESIRLFILDEADKLLEESFQEQINWIYSMLPDNKQMIALSATYPEYMAQQLTIYMRNPTFVRLNSEDPALLGIKQYFETAPFHPFPHTVFENKVKVLVKLLSSVSFHQCLVFSNLQARAQSLCDILNNKGWPSVCIAGCLDQEKRLQAMEKLKTFKCRVLISTDLTSRGIDAENVNFVVNLDLPHDHETYLHRIGRAGRFGSFGASIILVSGAEERDRLKTVEAKCNTCIHPLPDPIPVDLADRDVPVRLGELVTATKIITRPEESMFSSKTEEDSTSGDFRSAGNNNLCNLLQVDSSCASKTLTDWSTDRSGNVEKNDSGNIEENDLTEKSVNDSLNTGAEVETLMDDVGCRTEQDDVSGREGESSGCDLGECAVQENHANVEVSLLSGDTSSVGVMLKDVKETKGYLINTEVQHNQNDTKLMRTANEEIAGSLKKNSKEGETPDDGKEIDTSKKKGRKKKKTNKTFLQEEFGGGESFQIFNTDMVLLERPGSSKARSPVPPTPVIPELKITSTFSSENTMESTVNGTKPSKSRTLFTSEQAVSSEVPQSASCSQNADTSKPFPGVKIGKDNPFKVDIHGRKKIVAVRRRKFGVVTNSYQKNENTDSSNCGHSHDEKDLREKSCFTDGRNQKVPVLSANRDSTVKSVTHSANEHHNFKLTNGDLKSHTYSDALEDYENFLQTWEETSRNEDAGDLVTLLVQKCKAPKNGRSNGISQEMVSKTLNDVKFSHITPYCNSNGSQKNVEEKSENDLSTGLKTLSLNDDHPHVAIDVQSSSQTEQHISSRSQISFYSELTPKLNPRVGSEQQLEGNGDFNFVNLDTVSQVSSSILSQQNSNQSEAVASLNEAEMPQAPVYSKTRAEYQCALTNPIVHRTSQDSPDQAVTGKGHSTAKSTSEKSSSLTSSDTSSSSESSYDSDLDSNSESESLSEESLGNDRKWFHRNRKSSCEERYSGKNTFEDEGEENIQYRRHGYNSFRTSRQYPEYHYTQNHNGYHNTTESPGNREPFYLFPVPHRYSDQAYYPYAPSYPPAGRNPSWYTYYPNPYNQTPVHTSAYYLPCQRLSKYPTMNTFLKGDLQETDCCKMKKILKCQFDYLKYMKKS